MIAAAQRSGALARPRPCRLQRSRKKGARTPEGARYVGRPTLFGNPFRIDRFGHVRSVKLHEAWLEGRIAALTLERLGFCPAEIDTLARRRERILARLPELTGVDLQCWCPLTSKWCHADTLIALANCLRP
jgi:hypothetical protein